MDEMACELQPWLMFHLILESEPPVLLLYNKVSDVNFAFVVLQIFTHRIAELFFDS